MQYRSLGSTGLDVSVIAFGAGPVSQLLVGDQADAQRATVEAAVTAGVNWFDTAATYGEGRSEKNLGRTLAELHLADRVNVATKVRIMPHELGAIAATARNSVLASLRRLRVERVTLLQVHNSITGVAGAQPTSLTPAHVLAPGGLLDEIKKLQREGLVQHLGLTGLGEPAALCEVIDSGQFASVQIPYNLLNDSAGRDVPSDTTCESEDSCAESVDSTDHEANYGNVIGHCARHGMGVFAIRVLAGGALADRPPSPHTLKTPFFPLALYERDRRRAEDLARCLPSGVTLPEAAVRFALSHPQITSAIIGLATPAEVAAATHYAAAGPLHQVAGLIKWG